jgi:hypothetical protein
MAFKIRNHLDVSIPFPIARKQAAQDPFTLRGDIKKVCVSVRAIDLRTTPSGALAFLRLKLLLIAHPLSTPRETTRV